MFTFGFVTGLLLLLFIQSLLPTQTVALLTWIALRNRQLMAEIKKFILNRNNNVKTE